MMRIWPFVLTMVTPVLANSAGIVKYPVKPTDRLEISLAHAQVTLSPSREPAVTVSAAAGCHDLQVETSDNEWNLRETDLLKSHAEGAPCQIAISIPAQPADLHVLEGSITAQKLNNEVLLHVQKGKIVLRDSSGSAVVHMQRGDAMISDFQGRLRLDLQQASAIVKGLHGDLELESLGGDHLIEKPQGHLQVTQAQGSLKIVGGQGALQLETVRSSLTTQGFMGRIEGQTQEGTLSLILAGEPDVNLKSQGGRIVLQAPPGSGASVSMITQEGEIQGPAGFTIAREGSTRALKGRLKGNGKGTLIVRSQEGNLVLK